MENQVYEKVKAESQDFSKMRINRNLIFLKTLKIFVNDLGLWFIDVLIWTVIPSLFIALGFFPLNPFTVFFFVVIHFIYWKFAGEKNAKEFISEINEMELDIASKALQDLKKEKYGKNKNT